MRLTRSAELRVLNSAVMNPLCWATCVGACAQGTSQEHIISQTVFSDGVLMVEGMPWLKGERKELPKKVLAAGILCKPHNEMLSSVDAVAGHLSSALRDLAKGTHPPRLTIAVGCWNGGAKGAD